MFTIDTLGLVPRPRSIFLPETDTESTERVCVTCGETETTCGEDVEIIPPEMRVEALHAWQLAEAYRIEFQTDGPRMYARTPGGIRHAQRTLSRIQSATENVPVGLTIVDYPAYAWRGLSVDIVRHFFDAEELRSIVDLIASFGMNVFHLHLSDDQGWRLPIPEYPELIEKSSESAVDGDGGGYLTDAELTDLIAYAARQGIAVVPEVDVPGHTNAAKHAVVGLNANGVAPDTYTGIEVGFSTLEVAAPETDRFLDAVARVLAARSSGAVHIGGDECHATPPEEFAQIVSGMARRVRAEGRAVVAWQEAADYLEAGDFAQIWDERLDLSNLVRGAQRGVKVIASPATRIYLDMKHDENDPVGLVWAGTTELRTSLEWDPSALIPGVSAEAIAGVEAAIFTETIRTFDELVSMLLPRLAAAAEVAWAGSGVGQWESFANRIAVAAKEWRALGLPYHRSPGVTWPS